MKVPYWLTDGAVLADTLLAALDGKKSGAKLHPRL